MMRDSRNLLPAALLALLSVFSTLPTQAQSLRPSSNLSLPGVTSSAQRNADFIVAIVNSEPITNNEVRSRVLQIEQQLSAQGAAMPTRSDISRDVLERLINERAQVQLARDSGIRIEEQAIDNAVQGVARQNQISLAQLRQRMRDDGLDYNALRNNLRDELMLTRIREREVESRLRISDADIDQFIREQRDNPDASNIEVNLAQILVAVPENASAQQLATLQTKINRAASRARAGEDFATLVREFSDAATANGGQMGLRSPARYPDIFVEATRKLRSGELSEVIRSGAGFHLIKVVEKRQAGLESMTLTQSRARHILLRVTAQLSESAAIERLAQLRTRITSGSLDFAAAARENSQDGSAREGGDLGWANPGQFVPEFEEVMNSLQPGQISAPLVSRFGVHLIQLNERRERKLNDREQREAARGALREKKLEEAFNTWAQDVRARAYVEMREPPQ